MRRRLFSPAAPEPSVVSKVRAKVVTHVLALDAQLAARGWHELSPWWRETLADFAASGRRQLVLRVGRRGGKSSSLARVAVAEALYGGHVVPPGDVGVVAFVSVDRTEAAQRLRTIKQILDVLRVRFTAREGEVELVDRPIVFRVMSATVSGVSGATCIAAICDEVSKWRDNDTGANPAKEVIASLRPTLATMPSARLFVSSSPWSAADYHAELVGIGDTDHQRVAVAPTWISNPTLSEARTRELEPDPRVWRREYAAEPSDAVTSIASAEEVGACVEVGRESRPRRPEVVYSATLDLGLRNDRSALLVAHRELREAGADLADVLVIDRVLHLVPGFLSPLKLERVVEQIAATCRAYGVSRVYSDAHYQDATAPMLQERGVMLEVLPMMPAATTARIESLAHRITSRRLDLVDHQELKKEILQAQLEAHAGGRLTLRAPQRRGYHDDLVSALLLLCDADVQRRAMPPTGGEVHVEYEPVRWSPETHEVSGGGARYFRRDAGGTLMPCEPPYGSAAYERWALDRIEEGVTTPSIVRWMRERGVEPRPAGMLNETDWERLSVPVING